MWSRKIYYICDLSNFASHDASSLKHGVEPLSFFTYFMPYNPKWSMETVCVLVFLSLIHVIQGIMASWPWPNKSTLDPSPGYRLCLEPHGAVAQSWLHGRDTGNQRCSLFLDFCPQEQSSESEWPRDKADPNKPKVHNFFLRKSSIYSSFIEKELQTPTDRFTTQTCLPRGS